MTLTPCLGTPSGNQSLMSHTDITPVTTVETETESTQDLAAVLGKVFKCPHYNVPNSSVGSTYMLSGEQINEAEVDK